MADIDNKQETPSTATNSFEVYRAKSGISETFTDAKQAGAAFFNADRTERPTVLPCDKGR